MLETHALNTGIPPKKNKQTNKKQKTKNKTKQNKTKQNKIEKQINEHCITARKVHDIPSPQHIFLAP